MAISKTLKVELEELEKRYKRFGNKSQEKISLINEVINYLRPSIIRKFFADNFGRYILPVFAISVSAVDDANDKYCNDEQNTSQTCGDIDVCESSYCQSKENIEDNNCENNNEANNTTETEEENIIENTINAYESLHHIIEREFYNFSLIFDGENNIISRGEFSERIDYILEMFCGYLENNNSNNNSNNDNEIISQLLENRILLRLYLEEQYGSITLQDIERDGTIENWCIGECER